MLERPAVPRAVRVEKRQLAASSIRADQRETVGLVDDVHPEVRRREVRDRDAVRDPESNVVQSLRLHRSSITSGRRPPFPADDRPPCRWNTRLALLSVHRS
jgi:hypothetical protein